MKIAFWSQTECSGTTSNMLAVAALFSLLYPKEQVTVRCIAQKGESGVMPKRTKQAVIASEICFLDCGSGMSERKRQLLSEAAIVVVILKPERKELERFFSENIHWRREPLFLLGNCYTNSEYDSAYLERMYRIEPERLCVVSHNVEFGQAYRHGTLRKFVVQEYKRAGCLRNETLMSEVEQVVKLIRKHMERYR